ncbi:hypothetical protein Tco_0975780 [Tanacetum coccineum]|uniref:Uncharacterized protein n=1 Tax=Tanacetum coccineum TaxID=301880 RepID=A0ABQ5EFD3_9ASTR
MVISVKRDPLPSDDLVDLPLLEKLNGNRTLIRRYPETFLCLVGLSRSFDDPDARPTLLNHDKSDMGLLDFVKSVDPFKVKTGERTLAEGEVPLLKKTADMVVAPSSQTVRLVSHTIVNELEDHDSKKKRKVGFNTGLTPVKKVKTGGIVISEPVSNTAGKSLAVIQKLTDQSGHHNIGFGSAAPHTDEFVSYYVTPTPGHECQDDSDAIQGGNARTRRALERYVVLTSSSEHLDTGVNISLRVGFSNPHVQMKIGDAVVGPVDNTGVVSTPSHDTATTSFPGNGVGTSFVPRDEAGEIYVPHWDVTNDARLDDPVMCRNMIEHVSLPGFWASIRNRHDSNFLDLLNSSKIVQQRDAEIVALKAKVREAESAAA